MSTPSKKSLLGRASCTCFVLVLVWCLGIKVLLEIRHGSDPGSFVTRNQAYGILTVPIVGPLSIIGLLLGVAGCFKRGVDPASGLVGATANAVALLVMASLLFS
jgi:hypothetical protein